MYEKILKIKSLIKELNMLRDLYYNNSDSPISDYEYDKKFDKLSELEKETGYIQSNSPTQSVGYKTVSKLNKVQHTTPLLSLAKTQDMNEFIQFCDQNSVILMHKLDGLTIKLEYNNGELIKASTRGNGVEGDDITHNARCFDNIPLTIPITNHVNFIGEAIITKDVFEQINSNLPEDKKFKNARNLASGSVKQLDSRICKERKVKFICWNANDVSGDGTMETGLRVAKDCGFDTVQRFIPIPTNDYNENIPFLINKLKDVATGNFIPIDGIVAVYDNIEYGKSLGKTSHHFNNGFAFKFYDEEETSILTHIEWTMGKTGELTPVAIFNPVEIDGTTVTRASLHNISIIEDLKLGIGDEILVYKANQIIPQIRKSLTKSNCVVIPDKCPICGSSTEIATSYSNKNKPVKVLVCTNPNCKGKLLGKLNHFVSKSAMNIDGLSEATLNKCIELGLINNITDIYNLPKHRYELLSLEGFGNTSVSNLFNAIGKSKNTTLEKFINSLSIPTVGLSTAKLLTEFIEYDFTRIFDLGKMDLTVIDGIGPETNTAIHKWFEDTENVEMLKTLLSIVTFVHVDTNNIGTKLAGLNFVVTGKLTTYSSRSDIEHVIHDNGGNLQSAVSSNTNYLINNDINSTSGKNKKAKELGVTIITEHDFINMINQNSTVSNNNNPKKDNKKTKNSNKLF